MAAAAAAAGHCFLLQHIFPTFLANYASTERGNLQFSSDVRPFGFVAFLLTVAVLSVL